MENWKKISYLMLIMLSVTLVTVGVTLGILYQTHYEQQKIKLVEIVNTRASLIKAVARFDAINETDHPRGSRAATIDQIVESSNYFEGMGRTGEFMMGERQGDQIIFLLSTRENTRLTPKPVHITEQNAGPMRKALRGESGVGVDLDYIGTKVLAAYVPIPELRVALVAKMEVAEIRVPFLKAVRIIAPIILVLLGISLFAFNKISNPLVSQIDSSEAQTQLLLDSTAEAIYGLDNQGYCTFVNPACVMMLGYESADDLVGKHMHELIHHTLPDGSPIAEEDCKIYRAYWDGESSHNDSEVLWRADGTSFAAEYWSHPIINNGETIGSVVTFLDITERREAESALEDSEGKHRALIENLHDLIIIVDKDGVNQWHSPAARQFGMEPSELAGTQALDFVHDSDKERLQETLDYVVAHPGEIVTLEGLKSVTPDGDIRYLNDTITYLPDTPGINGIVVVVHDNTAEVEAQESIRQSLEEKEVLLKEIHHRVKNNLQIISSLLYLQSDKVKSPELVEALVESQNRVKTMALLHEKLYQSTSISVIDIDDYIRSLVEYLAHTYDTASKGVKINIKVDDVSLDLDTAIPLGLIINELISNTMKHAFPSGTGGTVNLSF
ncbi:MAG: PAS domain S-box protein, partial [Candidatus Marinimicrobia bacterium]|nr:PAS domain S-box protein [Candidatus Neomarinimicrobiota bacterium]